MAKEQKLNESKETAQAAVEQEYKDLSGKTLKELLDIKEAISYLIQYYDNYAQANTGNYQYDTKEIYETAKSMSLKYGKALVRVIKSITDKVNDELYR